jgi:hypothetical protein
MTVIWTLPGTFGPQQTDGTKPGDTAAQQSAYFLVATYRRVLARLFSRSAELFIHSAARLAMDPFEKKPFLPIELMIALATNVVVAILGYYAIMMWGFYRG